MKYLSIACNVLVGLVFTVFGLNGFLNFIPLPPMAPDSAAFVGVLVSSGFFTIVKILQIGLGVCILIGYQRPLMYLLIAPLALVIVMFELMVAKAPGIGIPVLLAIGYMIYYYRDRYMPIVAPA